MATFTVYNVQSLYVRHSWLQTSPARKYRVGWARPTRQPASLRRASKAECIRDEPEYVHEFI